MKTRSILLAGSLGLVLALGLIWMLAAGAGSAQAAPWSQDGNQFITVTVKTGESLATYAPLYGVSGSAMLAVNHLPNPNLIFPGQVITIPVVKSFTPSLTTPFFYTVQAGDTLAAIARRFEMDPGTIAAANGLQSDIVVLGKTYLIPAGPHVHIVHRGEHLGTIATKYGVSISFLLQANPAVANPSQLFVGQRIFIPIIYDARPVLLLTSTPSATPTDTATPTDAPEVATATALATAVPTDTPAVPAATSVPSATPIPSNLITVVVQPGESLVTYASRYGVSGSAMLAVNPKLQANPNLIFPGQVIVIPVVRSFTPSLTTPFLYTVQPGDNAAIIAARFDLAADTLISANPRESFAVGTTILVPAGPHVYIARPGDTLQTIAARYVTTVNFLLRANPSIVNPDFVFSGQRIFIPIRYDFVPIPFPP